MKGKKGKTQNYRNETKLDDQHLKGPRSHILSPLLTSHLTETSSITFYWQLYWLDAYISRRTKPSYGHNNQSKSNGFWHQKYCKKKRSNSKHNQNSFVITSSCAPENQFLFVANKRKTESLIRNKKPRSGSHLQSQRHPIDLSPEELHKSGLPVGKQSSHPLLLNTVDKRRQIEQASKQRRLNCPQTNTACCYRSRLVRGRSEAARKGGNCCRQARRVDVQRARERRNGSLYLTSLHGRPPSRLTESDVWLHLNRPVRVSPNWSPKPGSIRVERTLAIG